MKTKSFCLLITFAVALAAAGVRTVYAGGQLKEKTYSGIIISMDDKAKVLKLRNYVFSKSFVLGEDCSLMSSDNKSAALSEFRPGQRINVTYRDASGVLIASKIAQEKLTFTGMVQAINQNDRTLMVHHRGSTEKFTLPEDCTLVLAGDRRSRVENGKGLLENVQPGNRVTVVYEVPEGKMVAREIDQTSKAFVGTLDAVNQMENTISAAEGSHDDQRFHLADGCAIMVNNKPEGRLKNLRVVQKYALSYEVVDGVNVVNRIAPAGMPVAEASQPANTGGLAAH
jgi:hypothetical protein